jgi:hypothetical protein
VASESFIGGLQVTRAARFGQEVEFEGLVNFARNVDFPNADSVLFEGVSLGTLLEVDNRFVPFVTSLRTGIPDQTQIFSNIRYSRATFAVAMPDTTYKVALFPYNGLVTATFSPTQMSNSSFLIRWNDVTGTPISAQFIDMAVRIQVSHGGKIWMDSDSLTWRSGFRSVTAAKFGWILGGGVAFCAFYGAGHPGRTHPRKVYQRFTKDQTIMACVRRSDTISGLT